MTSRQVKIQYLLRKLRYKYKGDAKMNAEIDKIVWFSLPVVYPNFQEDSKIISKAINNRKVAKWRTKKYLNEMAESYDHLFFVTLTFDDETLNNTSEQTRHRYVSKYLKENVRCYYANVDYGSKNEREHYHAVVSDRVDFTKWNYGSINAKQVRRSTDGIATYMRKLTNHANKLGTGKAFHSRGLLEVDSLPF